MGVYIPNMEKPKQCADCQFEVIDTSGYPRCVIMRKMVVDGNLFNRCPLIEIPTPHGRLVDADKIFTYGHWEEQAVNEAPTILEAEE